MQLVLGFQSPEAEPALNRLLSSCARLEYFRLYAAGLGGFKPSSHLRCLVIRETGGTTLNRANCLAMAGSLRALRVNHSYSFYHPSERIPIAALTSLTYLGIKVDEANAAGFLAALESLHSLRALELRLEDNRLPDSRPSPALGIIASFPRHCTPHLEHLTINAKGHRILCAKELRAVGRHLPALKSLALVGGSRMEGGWDWLEAVIRRGRLEYLFVDGYYLGDCLEVPVQISTMAIRQCRVGNSRVLCTA